jgi:hypothetical protein
MAKLKDVVVYILEKYPHKHELSNARVTKLIYLADWYSAIKYKRQISSIDWYFDNYGPFVWDIYNLVTKDQEQFQIEHTTNSYGNEKKLISLKKSFHCNLSLEDRESIDKIIEATQALNWQEFINLVYSTHPILTTPKYNQLNLIEKASELENSKKM